MKNNKRHTTVGIDLGTTYSSISLCIDGQTTIIADNSGNSAIPSYVTFYKDGILVGSSAKNYAPICPQNTIFDSKRMIGLKYKDIVEEKMYWPFEVVERENGLPKIKVNWCDKIRFFYPEQISAQILKQLKTNAEEYLGYEVVDAVITVPASFNDGQRQATKDAGKLAGLNVIRIINEPTAAAIAYGVHNNSPEKKLVLVYDLGGGTFDVSILEAEDNCYTVLATDGNMHLGGQDFDNNMVKHFIKIFNEKNNCDISKDLRARSILKGECEKGKINLTGLKTVPIKCPKLYNGIDLEAVITREEFEDMNKDLFQTTLTTIKNVLIRIGKTPKDIDDIVLVGGSSKIPYVRKMLKAYFGKDPLRGIDPETAVAQGAALIAANIAEGEEKKFKFKDILHHSLGLKVGRDQMDFVLKAGRDIPCNETATYRTIDTNQNRMDLDVYEGENVSVTKNQFLGKIMIEGIPPGPPGSQKIDVNFQIDENNILIINGKLQNSDQNNLLEIMLNKSNLTEQEVIEISEQEKIDNEYFEKLEKTKDDLMNYISEIKNEINNYDDKDNQNIRDAEDKINELEIWFENTDNEYTLKSINEKLNQTKEVIQQLLIPKPTYKLNMYIKQINGNELTIPLSKQLQNIKADIENWINDNKDVGEDEVTIKHNETKDKIDDLFNIQNQINESIKEFNEYIQKEKDSIEENQELYHYIKLELQKVINESEDFIDHEKDNFDNSNEISSKYNEIKDKIKHLYDQQDKLKDLINEFNDYLQKTKDENNELTNNIKQKLERLIEEGENYLNYEKDNYNLDDVNKKYNEIKDKVNKLLNKDKEIKGKIQQFNEYIQNTKDQIKDNKQKIINEVKVEVESKIENVENWLQEEHKLKEINSEFDKFTQDIKLLIGELIIYPEPTPTPTPDNNEEKSEIEIVKSCFNDYIQETLDDIDSGCYNRAEVEKQKEAKNVLTEAKNWVNNDELSVKEVNEKLDQIKKEVLDLIGKPDKNPPYPKMRRLPIVKVTIGAISLLVIIEFIFAFFCK
ncbi:heat shock protein 70 [Histomonas meleagridis]|uniref:heat shock protein 70 n=1 Tax=Histomonas meleagridis TaxID=135588 RepID=UPI00355A77DA|nr:heat shock protein 70 [Histomonas meleagridis]KAH0798163.1 heat shock protein 70 [Histomonas meleagridis]